MTDLIPMTVIVTVSLMIQKRLLWDSDHPWAVTVQWYAVTAFGWVFDRVRSRS